MNYYKNASFGNVTCKLTLAPPFKTFPAETHDVNKHLGHILEVEYIFKSTHSLKFLKTMCYINLPKAEMLHFVGVTLGD